MGEVYRARDMRLKREVAVKVLPQEFATDPARRQRFEFEARTVATLNHPSIIAIYDVGMEDRTPYIVTELIDGEPLRGGVFALRKSLDCAVQIANGLAAAHDAGIVHRDLKPENILLTRDGHIKILDFGLARMSASRTAAVAAETLTIHTEPGVVMGTVGYMSPEQVRGKEADHRSDIFSFGVVLYELLSGGRAFQGETSVETMTAILKQELPELPETVPPGVREVVHHCLDKDPRQPFSVGARSVVCADRGIAKQGHERRRSESRRAAAPTPLDSYGGGGWGDGAGYRRFLAAGGPAPAHELDGIASGRPRSRLQAPSLARRTTACAFTLSRTAIHRSPL